MLSIRVSKSLNEASIKTNLRFFFWTSHLSKDKNGFKYLKRLRFWSFRNQGRQLVEIGDTKRIIDSEYLILLDESNIIESSSLKIFYSNFDLKLLSERLSRAIMGIRWALTSPKMCWYLGIAGTFLFAYFVSILFMDIIFELWCQSINTRVSILGWVSILSS